MDVTLWYGSHRGIRINEYYDHGEATPCSIEGHILLSRVRIMKQGK